MGDQADKSQEQQPGSKPAVDFGAIFGRNNNPGDAGLSPPAAGTSSGTAASDQLHVPTRDTTTKPADQVAQVRDTPAAPLDVRIENRALILSINDKDFDAKLSGAAKTWPKDFDKLKLTDIPPGVKVNYWQDPQGLFIWFEGGQDRGKKHYIPSNLTTLELPTQSKTIESIRIDVNRNYAQATFSNLQSFDGNFNPARDGGVNSIKYFGRIAGIADDALLKQEKVLRDAARTSDNPYYKLYLADVLTAAAVKPVINDFLRTGTADLNNPTTLRKLDEAISLLDAAYRDSSGKLREVNHFPRPNVYSPLMPGVPYWSSNRYPNDFYGFYAGVYDQSMARQASLKMIRDHIKLGSFPKFELPPNLPPRF
jgi:hypothetical protein